MKKSFASLLAALVIGGFSTISAQGYQDGVDNYNADRFDVAKTILEKTLGDPSTDKAVSDYYLGQIAFKDGNVSAAKQYFTEGSQVNPTYANNLIGLGQVALKEGDKKAAEDFFNQAMKLNKKDTEVIANVARAYFNVDPALYKDDIDKYITKAMKDSKNKEAAAYILQGDMAVNQNPGEAAGKYNMAISMDADKGSVNREAYVKYASAYFHVNPQYAIEKLVELNELEPNSALAQRELAEKYYDNKQFGSACLQYGKYMENPNHFQNDEQRYAGLLFSAERYDESLAIANKVLGVDPDNAYMYRLLMLNHNAQKNFAAAEEAGRRLFADQRVDKIPNDYILFADALLDQGKNDEAVEIYRQAVAANPDNAELLPSLSAALDRAGNGEEAVAVMKQYLDGGNGSANDIFNMARRYDNYARQLPEDSEERTAAALEGVKYINQAIEKVPDNPILYRVKAQLMLSAYGNKPSDEMAQAYEKMIELFDTDPANKEKNAPSYRAAYYMLGTYYMPIDKSKAKEMFENYLIIDPSDEKVKDIIDKLSK